MLLLYNFQHRQLNCVVLLLALLLIGNVNTQLNESSNKMENTKAPMVGSVKKELKLNITNETIVLITPSNEKHDTQTEKLNIIGQEKSPMEISNKEKGIKILSQSSEKTVILVTTSKSAIVETKHYQHHIDEDFVLNDENDASESLKTGFFFFLILSSGAILFIVFKIYRLRLSRAERKYGVQGDRSTQELTPLPISIEDGHSDDEDQTLFEVQRQNIRIL